MENVCVEENFLPQSRAPVLTGYYYQRRIGLRFLSRITMLKLLCKENCRHRRRTSRASLPVKAEGRKLGSLQRWIFIYKIELKNSYSFFQIQDLKKLKLVTHKATPDACFAMFAPYSKVPLCGCCKGPTKHKDMWKMRSLFLCFFFFCQNLIELSGSWRCLHTQSVNQNCIIPSWNALNA